METTSVRGGLTGLVADSQRLPDTDWTKVARRQRPHRSVADVALSGRRLVEEGASLNDLWRFVILQTLDHYVSAMKFGGKKAAIAVFEQEPPLTGVAEIDAALAALADYLGDRDGWQPPAWSELSGRRVSGWYVAQSPAFHAEADKESPEQFKQRGIYISASDLSRL